MKRKDKLLAQQYKKIGIRREMFNLSKITEIVNHHIILVQIYQSYQLNSNKKSKAIKNHMNKNKICQTIRTFRIFLNIRFHNILKRERLFKSLNF